MRIAHVLRKYDPAAWGGTETAVYQLISGLRGQGVESVLYAPMLGDVSSVSDPIVEAGFDVRRFRSFLPMVGLSAADRAQRISVGGNLVPLDLPWLLARDRPFDVFHSHALGRIGGAARLVARACRRPFVVTIHGGHLDLPPSVKAELADPPGDYLNFGKPFGLLLQARKVVPGADAVITCNPREAFLLRERHRGLNVVEMPHGIDIERYRTNHRERILTRFPTLRGRRVLLAVGRIDSVKNQAFLVRELPAILRRFPDALLVLAGPVTDPVHEAEVRRLIEHHNLHSHVLFTGPLGPGSPDLVGLYQHADVFLLSSRSETFGLVLLEAWAAGAAVIASNTSGARQVVTPDENGFLFELQDPTTFHRALDATFADAKANAARIEAGRRLVRERYATEVVASRFVNLYRDLGAKRLA